MQRLLSASCVTTPMNTQDAEICTTNALHQSGQGALFVDVRAPHDVATLAFDGPEVINLPYDRLALGWHALPRNREWVMVCQNGTKSAQASQFLRDQGVKNVSYMRGGILLWMQKGYPVLGKRFTTLEKEQH